MPESITVRCPECGAKLKLKSRAGLGKERPCPKCDVPFVLEEDSGQDVYDVDLNARGISPTEKPPMLKRGDSRRESRPRTEQSSGMGDYANKPLVIGLGVGGLIGLGMLIAFFLMPDGNGNPEPPPDSGEVAETSPETPETPSTRPGTPVRTNANGNGGGGRTPQPGSAGPIDLLAAADLEGDSLGGRWERHGAELRSVGSAKLKVPAQINGDYRVRMTFIREGDQQIMLALKAAGRRFVVVVNSKGNDVHGVSTINGKPVADTQNPTRKEFVTQAGGKYLLETDVKTNGNNVSVKSQLNGNLLFDWTGPAGQLDNGYWQIPTSIGIGSEARDNNAVVRYSELRLYALNGGAVSGGSSTTVASNTPPVRPNPPRPVNPDPPVTPGTTSPSPVTPSTPAVEVSAGDTIGFRNPGQGVYADTGVPTEWSASQNISWKTPMPGAGSSSPIVLGDRIYLTAYSGYAQTAENPGDISGLTFHVLGIDRANGEIIWNTPGKPTNRAMDYVGFMQQHGYASSTLATDGERLFAQFNNSGGFAFDLNGKLLWQIDLGPATHGFGSGASPVVHGDVVIFNASVESKALIAVNRATGREAWRTTKELSDSYTTPVIVPVGGHHELIVSSKAGLTGFNASNGELLWEFHAGRHTEDYACVTPIVHNGIVYGTQNRRSQLSAVRLGGRGDVSQSHKVWHNADRYDGTVVSPVLHNGHLFWPKDGQFAMFNAASGEIVAHGRGEWRRLYASPIVANGNLYVVSRFGGTYVAKATPELEAVSHNVIEGDDSQFNASPVVHQGQLLLRSDKFLYCIGERRVAAAGSRSPSTTASNGRNPGTSPASTTPTASVAPTSPPVKFKPDAASFASLAQPFLRQHCLQCHGPETQEGHFRVDQHLPNDFVDRQSVARWSEVLNVLNKGDMPPEGEPRPPQAEITRFVEWVEAERLRGERLRTDRTIVLRRINRAEYNNTIRDLIGIDFQPADEFPEDPPAGGFDNNGGALTTSPLHLEMYVKAAAQVFDRAILTDLQKPAPVKWHFKFDDLPKSMDGKRIQVDRSRPFIRRGDNPVKNGMVRLRFNSWNQFVVIDDFTPPAPGNYVIRVRAGTVIPERSQVLREGAAPYRQSRQEAARKNPDRSAGILQQLNQMLPDMQKHYQEDIRYDFGPPRMKISGLTKGAPWALPRIDADAPFNQPRNYEFTRHFESVSSSVRVSNVYHIPKHRLSGYLQAEGFPRPELWVDWVEIEGPIHPEWPPAHHSRILIDSPNKGRNEEAYARDVLTSFMRRAWRRPLHDGEVESKLALFKRIRGQKDSFEEAIKVPLTAVLSSPNFLYLAERGTSQSEPLDNHQLASRLSYYLWSTMPDDELIQLADRQQLTDPQVLRTQVDRLLADERCAAFVENFAGQWLKLREIGGNPPVRNLFPKYDDHLETSMRRESEEFFAHILHNDRPVTDFLKSDYVVINERLARFYGIRGVKGDHFRRVPVPNGVHRGGLVTQASILTITSNGTRTSPVERGVWMLSNLLDDPPPPPPPNAGEIPQKVPGQGKVTVRERLRIHRTSPQCARCHKKIDPLGFALENFDAAGAWRIQEANWILDNPYPNDPVIDATAQLPDGTRVDGVDGLRDALVQRGDQFLSCLTRKMYAYALGRELGFADEPVVHDAVAHMNENELTLRSLVHHIVASELFRRK